jgi:hypothetical protein
MKKFIILILLAAPYFAEAQMIPNGNFESWFFVGSSEHPEFWVTDNTEFQTTVSKDYDSYEGEIAMRVTAQPIGVGEYGEASTLFEIAAIPSALNFYAKTELEFGGVSVEITFLNNDNEVYTESWFNTENMPDYTLISIPLEQIEPVLTHVRITTSAQVGDLIAGTAWISVDKMEFGEPLKMENRKKEHFQIYPNPAKESLTITTQNNLIGKYKILDNTGKTVLEGIIPHSETQIDIRQLSPGIYTIFNASEIPALGKFIVE